LWDFINSSNRDLRQRDEPVVLSFYRQKLPLECIMIYTYGTLFLNAGQIEEVALPNMRPWPAVADTCLSPTEDLPPSDTQCVSSGVFTGLRVNPKLDRGLQEGIRNPDEKRGCELVIALMLSLFCAPLIVLAAVCVKLTSWGPAFYCQARLGRNGRRYTLYKLRTMRHNCEKDSGPCWSVPGDPRITRLGRFLRWTHIDELPQLLNVLRGEMSLVGPRPERPEIVTALEKAIPCYRKRLHVRPGITGLAQIHLPPDTDLESVRRKLPYDLYYVQHGSWGLDLRILLATLSGALGVPYNVLRKPLFLPAGELVEQTYQQVVQTRKGDGSAEFPS
jgi:lipopolysaccharide/colanic/teichoic acid biosynthesis glycosyltransferase